MSFHSLITSLKVVTKQQVPLPRPFNRSRSLTLTDSTQSILQPKAVSGLCAAAGQQTSSHGNSGLIIHRTFAPGIPQEGQAKTSDGGRRRSPHQSGGSNLPRHGLHGLSPCHPRLTDAGSGDARLTTGFIIIHMQLHPMHLLRCRSPSLYGSRHTPNYHMEG